VGDASWTRDVDSPHPIPNKTNKTIALNNVQRADTRLSFTVLTSTFQGLSP